MNKLTPNAKAHSQSPHALCRQEWRNNSRQHGNWWFTVEKDLKGLLKMRIIKRVAMRLAVCSAAMEMNL
jgi:hypothetical protein